MAVNVTPQSIPSTTDADLAFGPYQAIGVDAQSLPPATTPQASAPTPDIQWLIDVANTLKASLNGHFVRPGVHSVQDTSTLVSAPQAYDLDSAIFLLNDVLGCYNTHRVQDGVHGNTVVIRLTPPDGTLYDRLKFWTSSSGTPRLTSTISDDEGQ